MKPRLLVCGYVLIFLCSFTKLVDNAAVLLPYGVNEGDQQLSLSSSGDTPASAATTLPQPFIFFERQHTELFISENGAISFSAPITNGPGQELDAEKKDIIAVFYAPSTSGSVFYRSSQGGSPLSREVSAKIRRAFFTDANTFEAESVVLITWENVQQQDSPTSNNTYQLAMATDTKNSYAVFVYHKIGWAAATPGNQNPQKYAQAGFFSADGRTEKLVNSGTRAVTDLTKITNFLEPGLFLYRISGSHPQDPRHNGVASLNAEEEYIYQDAEGEYDPDEPITDCPSDPFRDHCPAHCNVVTDDRDCSLCICSSMVSENIGNSPSYSKVSPNHSPSGTEPVVDDGQPPVEPLGNEVSPIVEEGGRVEQPAVVQPPVAPPTSSRNADLSCNPQSHGQCHAKADCIHFAQADNTPAGYCCECNPDHYGNGMECLPKDGPQRINGIFEAVINGKAIEKTDLFAYIQVQDGQQHTALARIPKDVGHSLALLDAIGNGMGWLFAKDSSVTPNVFNGFQLTGGSFNRTVNIHLGDRYTIAIKQQFTDREFRDSFAVNMFVSGTLPELAPNSKTTITFPSFQETYKRERAGVIRAYNERHITIQEEGQEEKQYRVTTDQQIHYKECSPKIMSSVNEQVVRFDRISAQFNAEEGVVRFASQALAGAGQVPAPGTPVNGNAISHAGGPYANVVDNPNDPCALGAHYCTQPNMVCRVRQRTYSCECQDGYHFERDTSLEAGFRCVSSEHTSPPLAGHQTGCSGHHECHQWGECVAGQCKCRGWYVGDGIKHCGPPEETIIQPVDTLNKPQQACGEYTCDTNADCIGSDESTKNCVCKIGYTGNGMRCVSSTAHRNRDSYEHSPSVSIGTICRGDRECGVNARCVYNAKVNYYRCECLPSYTGDGVKCSQEISIAPSDNSCESKLGCHSQAICVANGTQPICQCNEGYFGDGRTCVSGRGSMVQPVVQPLEQCQDQSNCHPSAHCVQVESTNQYNCQCLPGYEGDGIHSCVHAEECSPSNDQSCSQKAKCLFSSNNQKFTCQCEPGFTRQNGQCLPSAVAHPEQPSAVNAVCERCALEARCEQHPSNRQYTCVCNPGYEGNGYICTRPKPAPVALSCLDNREMCSAYAQCVPNQQQTAYVCNCNYGYRGNGLVCEPVLSQQPQEDTTLLIGRGMSLIQRSPTNLEVPGKQLVVVPHQVVVDIAYDCHSKQIYWSDISGHSIRSVALNGSNLQSSYSSELRSPEGIAIDWSSRNLYYVDSIRNELGVVSLQKGYQKAMLTEGLVNPRALVIDMHNRHLYYSDWHRENPHIGRIDLDGSNNQVFVSEEVHLPNGLALLPGRKELCWVDAGSHRLSCIGLDGSGRRAVYAPLEYPFGLTCFQEQRFYWTDWNDHKIHSVSIYGDGYNVFAPGAGGKGKIYGILSLPLKCHEPPTACANNNGGCPHMCLPSANGGVVCKCPDNVTGLDGC